MAWRTPTMVSMPRAIQEVNAVQSPSVQMMSPLEPMNLHPACSPCTAVRFFPVARYFLMERKMRKRQMKRRLKLEKTVKHMPGTSISVTKRWQHSQTNLCVKLAWSGIIKKVSQNLRNFTNFSFSSFSACFSWLGCTDCRLLRMTTYTIRSKSPSDMIAIATWRVTWQKQSYKVSPRKILIWGSVV